MSRSWSDANFRFWRVSAVEADLLNGGPGWLADVASCPKVAIQEFV
jgi:hypothetical protein